MICFLFDPNVGGQTIRARAISRQLRDDGITVIFAIPNTNGTALAYLEEQGFEVVDLGIPKPILPRKLTAFAKFAVTSPISLVRLWWFLHKRQPDAIHVNGAYDILPALAGRLNGTPVLWHLNDTVFGPRLSHTLGRLVSRIATRVAVTSTRVTEHYGVEAEDPVVLPVPVDLGIFQAKTDSLSSRPTLGLVGNWNWIKQQDLFLDIIDGLLTRGYDVRAEMIGTLLESQEGYWRPILKRAEQMNDRVHVAGFQSDIPAAMRTMDILLVTSKSESGPLSCIEAMASGVPVVSFDVGDVRNMLDPDGPKPGGYVVAQGDVAAAVNACETLLTQPELYRTISRNARARVREHYSLPISASRTKTAYLGAAGYARGQEQWEN